METSTLAMTYLLSRLSLARLDMPDTKHLTASHPGPTPPHVPPYSPASLHSPLPQYCFDFWSSTSSSVRTTLLPIVLGHGQNDTTYGGAGTPPTSPTKEKHVHINMVASQHHRFQ